MERRGRYRQPQPDAAGAGAQQEDFSSGAQHTCCSAGVQQAAGCAGAVGVAGLVWGAFMGRLVG
jgi:hypothetical protein